MDIKEFCRNLDRLIASRDLRGEGLDTVIKAVSQGFNVTPGEISLLLVDENEESLYFVWPKELKNFGTIPLTAKESLAAKSFRDRDGQINNRFTAARHASIFELLPLKEQFGPNHPIQKIMSVPVRNPERCFGVLQVSRKAADLAEAGADFNQTDLRDAELVGRILARHL